MSAFEPRASPAAGKPDRRRGRPAPRQGISRLSFPADDPAQWNDLFIATAGASAALTGLVFVAVSINIRPILDEPGLPERAAEPLTFLLGVLTVSILALVPGQGAVALGTELAIGSVILAAVIAYLINSGRKRHMRHAWLIGRSVLAVPGTVPFIIGSVSLLAGGGGGLAWVVAGILGATIGAVYSAWIVLVEILR